MISAKTPWEIDTLVLAGSESVRTVLMRPKNIRKPPFSQDLSQLYHGASLEMAELSIELRKIQQGFNGLMEYEAAMYEAADACAFLFAIIKTCRDKIAGIEHPTSQTAVDKIVIKH